MEQRCTLLTHPLTFINGTEENTTFLSRSIIFPFTSYQNFPLTFLPIFHQYFQFLKPISVNLWRQFLFKPISNSFLPIFHQYLQFQFNQTPIFHFLKPISANLDRQFPIFHQFSIPQTNSGQFIIKFHLNSSHFYQFWPKFHQFQWTFSSIPISNSNWLINE